MDEIAQYNRDRWEALVRARAVFTRPLLDLTPESAQARVDPERRMGDLAGRRVLCLAGGGGQHSAAFALLGAVVTVFDLSPAQLQRDQEAAAHYHLAIQTEQGDMRDLARFDPASFDIVCQPYSLNFVPNAGAVFRGVARVIRPGGLYWFNCANPFLAGLNASDWDGTGYPLRQPYVDGAAIPYADPPWVFWGQPPAETIPGPVEYRHTLSTLINGLVARGFTVTRVLEEYLGSADPSAAPGTDEHFTTVAPPWLEFWSTYHGS